ncbi:MAG TPA: hypothetical protein PKC54_05485 [Ferruginibacter sp.]|nr:hypothetical protein [Ferruginibacter sp.]
MPQHFYTGILRNNMSEENKNTEPEDQPEKKSEEITSSEEMLMPGIEEPQTEADMEVHHHTHPAHGKKTWKDYFWEFLMLFLAVFCGFLAEYQLEHKIERDREKKFIQTFIEDLKIDTAAINANLVSRKKKREQLDSLTYLLSEQKIKGYENELYYLGRLLIRTSRFQSNDRTITQLKYSGSMRLIRNEEAADSIISYQKLVDIILQNQEDDRIERRAVDPVLNHMFNPFVFDKMLDEFNNVNKPAGNPPLRSYDPSVQQDLAFCINQIKGSNIIISTRLKLLNEKAKNIIKFLKEEYHLE